MNNKLPQDVGIAFLGFDSDRIYLPCKKLKCERLYILKKKDPEDDNAQYNLDLIKKALPGVEIIEKTPAQNPYLRIHAVKEIFEAERQNRIYVNLSTGSKLDAIAGMLACMLFAKEKNTGDVRAFYAIPVGSGRQNKHSKFFSETQGLKDIQWISFLELELTRPSLTQIAALKILLDAKQPLKKKEVIDRLLKAGHLPDYDRTEKGKKKRNLESARYHAAENQIFKSLKERWKAINEERAGRSQKLTLDENGRMLLSIFDGSA